VRTDASGTPAFANCSAAPSPASIMMVCLPEISRLAGCDRRGLATGPAMVPRVMKLEAEAVAATA
jgi:hypothetical protein